jgi:RNA polymerase sigma factor (sigma-70 family)
MNKTQEMPGRHAEDLKHRMLAYQKGDEQAFDWLFKYYRPLVFGYLRRRLDNKEQCEDVMQACFLKFHTSRHSYDPTHPVDAWMFVIARSCLSDFLRSRQLEQKKQKSFSMEQAEAVPPSIEIPLESLSERERTAIHYRYGEDLDFGEIAERIGLKEANVRKVLSRALQHLRSLLGVGNAG